MAKTEAGTQGCRRLGRPPGTPESVRRNRVVNLMTGAESEKLTKSLTSTANWSPLWFMKSCCGLSIDESKHR